MVTIVAAKTTELAQSQEFRCFSPVMVTPWPAAFDTVWESKHRQISPIHKLLFLNNTNNKRFIVAIITIAAPGALTADTPWANIQIFEVEADMHLHAQHSAMCCSNLTTSLCCENMNIRLQPKNIWWCYCDKSCFSQAGVVHSGKTGSEVS